MPSLAQGQRLGGELASQGLRAGLALPWQELVLAVAATAWWPRACGLPCAGFALGASGTEGWHPYVVTAGKKPSPSGITALREGRVRLPNFAWEAGRRRQAVIGKLMKIAQSRPQNRGERDTPITDIALCPAET